MKLTIVDKQTGAPALILSEDEKGMNVISGDPSYVTALGIGDLQNVKAVADYINSDPNGQFQAQLDQEEGSEQEPADMDAQLAPALEQIKELMRRVKDRHDAKNQAEVDNTAEGRASKSFGAQAIASLNDQIYVSLDGDNIGNAVARAEETDDEKELAAISSRINRGQEVLKIWAELLGGRVIEQGGDEGLVKVPRSAIEEVENLRQKYFQAVGATASVGVGNKLSESTKARMLAKLKGKDRTVIFDESVPKQLEMLLADEDGQGEAKKMRLAMRPDQSQGAIQPAAQQEPAQQEQPQQQQQEPEQQEEASQEQQEPAPQESVQEEGDAEPEDQEEDQGLSSELLQSLHKSQHQAKSVTGTAMHDDEIENDDYSYSEEPEFSKALAYAVRYGSGKGKKRG